MILYRKGFLILGRLCRYNIGMPFNHMTMDQKNLHWLGGKRTLQEIDVKTGIKEKQSDIDKQIVKQLLVMTKYRERIINLTDEEELCKTEYLLFEYSEGDLPLYLVGMVGFKRAGLNSVFGGG